MIAAFCFGLAAAFVTGLVGDYAWRRLPAPLGAVAVVLAAAAVSASVSVAAHLHLHLTGLAVPALVVGLILGGNSAHAITVRTPQHHSH